MNSRVQKHSLQYIYIYPYFNIYSIPQVYISRIYENKNILQENNKKNKKKYKREKLTQVVYIYIYTHTIIIIFKQYDG